MYVVFQTRDILVWQIHLINWLYTIQVTIATTYITSAMSIYYTALLRVLCTCISCCLNHVNVWLRVVTLNAALLRGVTTQAPLRDGDTCQLTWRTANSTWTCYDGCSKSVRCDGDCKHDRYRRLCCSRTSSRSGLRDLGLTHSDHHCLVCRI